MKPELLVTIERKDKMKLNFTKIIKWYGLPMGIIIGNFTADYSLQIYCACVLAGYLIGSFLYITDDKES